MICTRRCVRICILTSATAVGLFLFVNAFTTKRLRTFKKAQDLVESLPFEPNPTTETRPPATTEAPQPWLPMSDCPEHHKIQPCENTSAPDLARMAASGYRVPVCVNDEKFTVVLLTHGENRIKLMMQSLENFSKMKNIHKIILLWNNQGMEPPNIEKNITFAMPLVIIRLKENRLRLRFQPLDEIETQGVFSIDDDLLVEETDLLAAFDLWKKHSYGIVGFTDNSRRHYPEISSDHFYLYRQQREPPYSIILTSAAFLHKEYLRLFTEALPKGIADFIDSSFNCEDIAMNMLITNHTNSPPAARIGETTPIKHIAGLAGPGLGSRKGHYQDRSKCIRRFAAYFPLRSTECVYE